MGAMIRSLGALNGGDGFQDHTRYLVLYERHDFSSPEGIGL